MKIKQGKIIKAYNATEKFSKDESISLEIKWKLYNMRRIMRPFYEFQSEQEVNIRNKYIQYADEKGNISGKPYTNFLSELEALSALDMDFDMPEKFSIILTDKSCFTVQDMEALEDFVDFVCKTGE